MGGSGPYGQHSFSCKSSRAVVSPSCRNRGQSILKQLIISLNAPAEITRARLRPRPMVIAPVIHVSHHPTTCPPESVWAVFVEFFQVSLEPGLKCLLEIIALLKVTRAKTNVFLLTHPSNQLQLSFVFRTISASAVLIVPIPAEFLVCRPILPLAIDAFKTTRRQIMY